MKKIWIFSIVALLFAGCEGFLDSENLTKKDNSNFPKKFRRCGNCTDWGLCVAS